MNKFKKATQKIAAVGTIGLIAASSVFAAGLGDYPSNFVKDGKFDGQIVVGASAATIDSTSAMSIIQDLKSEFSGENEKVKLTYKKASAGGDSVNIVKSNTELNYGESLTTATEKLDDGDIDFLTDGKFENGVSDEDYTQEIEFTDGTFNYALRDNVDDVTAISDNLYFDSGDTYLTYTLKFKNDIEVSTDNSENDKNFVGKVLTIMGNEFTIAGVSQSAGNITSLDLIGGSNKVSLGESESTKVTINGKSYDVAVQSVSDDKVLLTVNGQSKSIDEYDTEKIAGISVAVTDLVASSRDAVKGYAEIVVGGQKVTLDDNGEVKVNDDDVSDLYPDYLVDSEIEVGGFTKITITYKVDDDTSLEAGDSLIDPLFGGFELAFEGTNNPSYSTLEIKADDDVIKLTGELTNGEDLSREFLYTTSTNGTNGVTYVRGAQDEDRIFFEGSMTGLITGVDLIAADTLQLFFNETVTKGSGLFLYSDIDTQYLYEIDSVSTSDKTVSLKDIIDGDEAEDVELSELGDALEVSFTTSETTTYVNVTLDGNFEPTLKFANELVMDFANSEADLDGGEAITDSYLTFSLDDVEADNDVDKNEVVNVTLSWDDSDDQLRVTIPADTDFVNRNLADTISSSSDIKKYVTVYGTVYEYDNDDHTYVKISTPDEQVNAKVSLVTGGSASSAMTVEVDADKVADKKAELEDDGYVITGEETVVAEAVEFDVTSAVNDEDVSGTSNMIVVGGPAVNSVARELLGIDTYTIDKAGVAVGEGLIKYFSDSNTVLVYGYSGEDTAAAVAELNNGGLTGTEKRI